jgi:alkyl hydroperoxide reductase subunit AhpC
MHARKNMEIGVRDYGKTGTANYVKVSSERGSYVVEQDLNLGMSYIYAYSVKRNASNMIRIDDAVAYQLIEVVKNTSTWEDAFHFLKYVFYKVLEADLKTL